MNQQRRDLCEFLQVRFRDDVVPFTTEESVQEVGYRRVRIRYESADNDTIPAYFLLPDGEGPFAGVLIHHQHNGERHLGKSEVCGLVGDPWQAFGPALAKQGIAVLAPDSVCFEDRRTNHSGTEAHADDTAQHYNMMCYRLLHGESLMKKVLLDSAQGISLLRTHPQIDNGRIGMLGHSYGGSTTLYHAPLDERIRFACSSGAACSYAQRFADQLGIEMSSVIPGFVQRFDLPDLVACMAPRPFLIVSASHDKHSQDAGCIVQLAEEACSAAGIPSRITHQRYDGEHPVTPERFTAIIEWLASYG